VKRRAGCRLNYHNNGKAGGYHCHRGSLAGEVFGSKAEMLEKLKGISHHSGHSTELSAVDEPAIFRLTLLEIEVIGDLKGLECNRAVVENFG
jgi:hypothetical protein